ncbi:hypothetical protein J4E08_07000 [Sagittula sp. NFXS13]|uniref:hypothetical protein n=1 Tax=Sagittula sp. NFXS13 TaxID=2819095 RepID=UPI0032DF4B5D
MLAAMLNLVTTTKGQCHRAPRVSDGITLAFPEVHFAVPPVMTVVQIPLPCSALGALPHDPNPVLEALADAFATLTQQGLYHHDELHPAMLRAAMVDLYRREVLAGGHARFVRTIIALGLGNVAVRHVVQGLRALKAEPYEILARSMAKWCKAHGHVEIPDDVPALDRLDIPFARLNRIAPLGVRIARWMAEHPDHVVIPDRHWKQALGLYCDDNLDRARRLEQRDFHKIAARFEDRHTIAIAEALRLLNRGDVIRQMDRPVHSWTGATQATTQTIQLDSGATLMAVTDDAGLSLFAMPDAEAADIIADDLLIHLSAAEIAARCTHLGQMHLATALHVLASRHADVRNPRFGQLSLPDPSDDTTVHVTLTDGEQRFELRLTPSGATLKSAQDGVHMYLPHGQLTPYSARLAHR